LRYTGQSKTRLVKKTTKPPLSIMGPAEVSFFGSSFPEDPDSDAMLLLELPKSLCLPPRRKPIIQVVVKSLDVAAENKSISAHSNQTWL
jgi:hypothetical protein